MDAVKKTNVRTVCVSTKHKADYFLAQRHRTTGKRSNFRRTAIQETIASPAMDYVFHLTCVMQIFTWRNVSDKLHFGDETCSKNKDKICI